MWHGMDYGSTGASSPFQDLFQPFHQFTLPFHLMQNLQEWLVKKPKNLLIIIPSLNVVHLLSLQWQGQSRRTLQIGGKVTILVVASVFISKRIKLWSCDHACVCQVCMYVWRLLILVPFLEMSWIILKCQFDFFFLNQKKNRTESQHFPTEYLDLNETTFSKRKLVHEKHFDQLEL